MRYFMILCTIGLLLGFAAGGPGVLSATATAAPGTVPLLDEQEARKAFEPHKRRFQMLYRSLDAQGGIAEENIPTIRNVQRQVREFNEQFPGYTPALAAELQLSAWLEEHDRVDVLYERIVRANPDSPEYVDAWTAYFSRIGQRERADEIFERVLREHPHNVELVMKRARQLRQQNDYPRMIDLLERAQPDPAEHPRAVLLLAEALHADNRFEEALATLEQFDDEMMEDDRFVRTQVTQKRESYSATLERWRQEQEYRAAEASRDDLPRVRLMTERGEIVVELFEDHAPNTVANFITLVEDGFYNGTRFHRVIPNFMAQGGDPHSHPDVDGPEGQGGPGYNIPDEHDREDARIHFAGSLSMANTGAPNSGGSQFFLTHLPTDWLDGRHTVFGRVLDGLEVVRAIRRHDELTSAEVIRKRDHDYAFEKIADEEDLEAFPESEFVPEEEEIAAEEDDELPLPDFPLP